MSRVIGRGRYARETYPETGSAAGSPALARNSAYGPAVDHTDVGDSAQIPWAYLEVGTSGLTNVPITPRSTGIVRVVAMIGVLTVADDDVVTVTLQVGGVSVPGASTASAKVPGGAHAEIPFTFDIWGGTGGSHPSPLPLHVASDIELLVSWGSVGNVTILANQSSIDVQELPAVTG